MILLVYRRLRGLAKANSIIRQPILELMRKLSIILVAGWSSGLLQYQVYVIV